LVVQRPVALLAGQAVLLAGGGRIGAAETTGEGRDVADPGMVGGEQVARRPALAGHRRGQVERPARRDPLAAAAEVAAGDPDPLVRGGRERGQQLALLAAAAFAPQVELTTRARPLVVGEQGVVADRCRVAALHHAQHGDEVEVEPDAHADEADGDALAEAAGPAEIGLELGHQGAAEHVEADRALDGVEVGEAAQRALDPLGGRTLAVGPAGPDLGAAQVALEHVARPAGAGAPACRGHGNLQGVDQVEHERAQRGGLLPVVLHLGGQRRWDVGVVPHGGGDGPVLGREVGEPFVPMGAPGHDAGGPRQPLPRPDRQRPTALDHGQRGQPGEDVGAAEAAGGQVEQLQQRPAGHPGAEGGNGGAVARDTRRLEVLVHQPGVGLGGGVEDRHPVEGNAPLRCGQQCPHHGPDLLVGVGRGHQLGAPTGLEGQRPSSLAPPTAGQGTEPGHGRSHFGIGRLDTRRPGHDPQRTPLGAGGQERHCVAGQPLGQVEDHRLRGRPRLRRRGHQVVFVVEEFGQPALGRPVEPHHVPRPGAAGSERAERTRGQVP
jgi:hypothetical protein